MSNASTLPAADQPHPVDKHVGARLRLRRTMAHLSQTEIAAAIGVSFQQVQKYENGANRISASKLHEFAKALDTPISWFFEDLDDPIGEPADDPAGTLLNNQIKRFLGTLDGVRLATAYPKLSLAAQRQILALAETLAGIADEPEAASRA